MWGHRGRGFWLLPISWAASRTGTEKRPAASVGQHRATGTQEKTGRGTGETMRTEKKGRGWKGRGFCKRRVGGERRDCWLRMVWMVVAAGEQMWGLGTELDSGWRKKSDWLMGWVELKERWDSVC